MTERDYAIQFAWRLLLQAEADHQSEAHLSTETLRLVLEELDTARRTLAEQNYSLSLYAQAMENEA